MEYGMKNGYEHGIFLRNMYKCWEYLEEKSKVLPKKTHPHNKTLINIFLQYFLTISHNCKNF